MGSSRSFDELASKLARFGGEMKDTKRALNAAGLAGKRILEGRASQAGVLGSKLAGKRKAVKVRYDVMGDSLVIGYTGPAHLVNNPTAPHKITPRRRGRKRALTIGGNVRASAQHPGTSGKRFAGRAIAEARVEVPKVLVEHFTDLARRF